MCTLVFSGGVVSRSSQQLDSINKNVQSARKLRFTSVQEIKNGPEIKTFIKESIQNEIKSALLSSKELQKEFESLTSRQQSLCLLFFASAKQSKTRKRRIKEYTSNILNGKGLND